ncbi:uncharacterized protein M6B38_282160 [Iris pallida]|uniref:Uncharacterized protein n=1 Tax=Iris pallida TaxID=29817 RepID=A0AAX6I267_IRIPA|nr:uncharacterized protein M6B38_282160 [Iris pallida]
MSGSLAEEKGMEAAEWRGRKRTPKPEVVLRKWMGTLRRGANSSLRVHRVKHSSMSSLPLCGQQLYSRGSQLDRSLPWSLSSRPLPFPSTYINLTMYIEFEFRIKKEKL